MSLSSCRMCWDTPCTCGWEYITYSHAGLLKTKEMIDNVILFKTKYPEICDMPESERIKIWNDFQEEGSKEADAEAYVEQISIENDPMALSYLFGLMCSVGIHEQNFIDEHTKRYLEENGITDKSKTADVAFDGIKLI